MATDGLSKIVEEAVKSAKERKFKESIELAINMREVDLSDPKNRVNEEIPLPKGRGKDIKVAIFGSEEMKSKAKGSADYFFGAEDISKFQENKKDFKKIVNSVDYFIAESNLMAGIGKSLGQVLGPRGKIPRPLPPGQDPNALITSLKRTVRARSKDKRTFHVPVGTRDMSPADVAENISAVIKRITGKLEKGMNNIDSLYVKTTMGKAVKIEAGDIK
ncbi:MAG: 50S ribosomal protein L1 [Thermoplasmataceae archaeon]